MGTDAIAGPAAIRRRAFAAALPLAAALLSTCGSPALAGDPAAGRRAAQACAVCHGELGLSEQPDAPNLAGQPEIYIAAQLRAYRAGERAHAVMSVVAQPLSDAQIDDLAAWFSSLEVSVKAPGS